MNNIDKLIEKLIKESLKQEEVTLEADSKKMSQQSIKIFELTEDLRKAGVEAYGKLSPLLDYSNNYVKLNVAYSLIPVYPERAKKALLEVSKSKGLIAFRADMILQQWADGVLKID